MRNYKISYILFFITTLCCVIACGGDDDDNPVGNTIKPTSFYQPATEGWNDLGNTCYFVYPKDEDSRRDKAHYKWVFTSSADTAKCIYAAYETLCTDADAAISFSKDLSADNPTIEEERIVVVKVNNDIGRTKAEIKQIWAPGSSTTPDDDDDDDVTKKPELDSAFMVGKWVITRTYQSLDGEELTLEGEGYSTKRWEFKSDGTAVVSYRSWNSRWNEYDSWKESTKNKYTWSISTYGNTYLFVITRHDGTKGFGDYKETYIRRYFTNWSEDSFSWKNADDELMDNKPYKIAEKYIRE